MLKMIRNFNQTLDNNPRFRNLAYKVGKWYVLYIVVFYIPFTAVCWYQWYINKLGREKAEAEDNQQ